MILKLPFGCSMQEFVYQIPRMNKDLPFGSNKVAKKQHLWQVHAQKAGHLPGGLLRLTSKKRTFKSHLVLRCLFVRAVMLGLLPATCFLRPDSKPGNTYCYICGIAYFPSVFPSPSFTHTHTPWLLALSAFKTFPPVKFFNLKSLTGIYIFLF